MSDNSEITAIITTEEPAVAATLDELRYLVFEGKKGDTGDSAYAEAVKLGFEGTEAEWLASLKGEKGDTGATGATGEKGDKGDKGERGETGATGATGTDGVSPTVSTSSVPGGTRVTITDKNGDHAFDVMNGQDGGMSGAVKQALLDCFENVAWINDDGQTYYDALYAALYPPADVVSISAVFTQGDNIIYDTDSLDTLKQYLVVTATMSDSTTQTVTDYTLSGTLTVGTSVITVSYGEKTTTFNVTVSEPQHLTGYTTVGNPTIDGQNRMTTSDGNFIKTPFNFDNGGLPWELRAKVNVSETNQPFVNNAGFYDIINCVNSQNASTRGILVEFNHSGGAYDYKLNLFASDTANSWNIVSPQSESISIQSLFNGDVYIKAGWTGSAYYIAASADGVTWSNELRHEWTGKTTSIMTGYPIAFGNKRNKAWGYCIYVDSLELDIDGALYWKAVG